jgi:cyclopropane fatty-acyl-phospholipid synthase-like methyltransferase
MPEKFYDKIARKFGAFAPDVAYTTEYPAGNPEKIFEQKLVDLGSPDKTALDVGCGSGSFTLRMAPHFSQVIGIDHSEERLKQARALQQSQDNKNVLFYARNAQHTDFAQDTFDVVYSRRGPTYYSEYSRILKLYGHVVVIGIGEKDTWELQQTFGRGQGFREWPVTALEQAIAQLQEEHFSVVYGQDFGYNEYYATYADLDLFLQSVPIFEDFDSAKDRSMLEKYVAASQTPKGISLPRHRFVVVAEKLSWLTKLT